MVLNIGSIKFSLTSIPFKHSRCCLFKVCSVKNMPLVDIDMVVWTVWTHMVINLLALLEIVYVLLTRIRLNYLKLQQTKWTFLLGDCPVLGLPTLWMVISSGLFQFFSGQACCFHFSFLPHSCLICGNLICFMLMKDFEMKSHTLAQCLQIKVHLEILFLVLTCHELKVFTGNERLTVCFRKRRLCATVLKL